MTQFESRNITMMMDLYEMTMAYGYFKENDTEKKVAFDVFYRRNPDGGGFSIFAGLEQVIEYLENMHFEDEDVEYFRSLNLFDEDFLAYLKNFRFNGDVYAFEEGTIMYPNEPVVTVVAPLIEAQLVENAIFAQINHQSLIASKSRRIVKAAAGRGVSDFGARRAHNMDAAIYGARASYIGGVNGTATVSAGQMFGIPVGGTHAHSWVMEHSDELTAFRSYAKVFPNNCTLLVDTYDVLKSGVPNAIKVFQEMKDAGIPLTRYGIRLDSGDLAYISKKARKMLDAAGFPDAVIKEMTGLSEIKHVPACYRMVDTCSAEFTASTPYIYSTFGEDDEAEEFINEIASGIPVVMVFGSGPIRIGQGIEFDFASVHCVWSLKRAGYEVVIINNNPKTDTTNIN